LYYILQIFLYLRKLWLVL